MSAEPQLQLGVGVSSFLAEAHSLYFTPAHLIALIDPPKFDLLSLILIDPSRP